MGEDVKTEQPTQEATDQASDTPEPAAEQPVNGAAPGQAEEGQPTQEAPATVDEPAAAADPAPVEEAPPAAEPPAAEEAPAAAEPPAAEEAPAAAHTADAPTFDVPAPADAPAEPAAAAEATPPAAPAPPAARRPPRPREPLPWPELRAAATAVSESVGVEDLKDLFRLLPNDVREETVEGVRTYRKGARRPVSAFAGKSLARAVHTARRARRRPESDDAVSEALGQALAAEVIASLDVEIAAEVILPKRDLLEREARNARRRQREEQDRSRDERRRRSREENAGAGAGAVSGTYSGSKIRGLDQLAKLFEDDKGKGEDK